MQLRSPRRAAGTIKASQYLLGEVKSPVKLVCGALSPPTSMALEEPLPRLPACPPGGSTSSDILDQETVRNKRTDLKILPYY